jgi:hypothetical protein
MPLPTFIIAGERRCGTTSLYHWMRSHPEVYLYPKPDSDYFIEEEALYNNGVRQEPDGERWEKTHSIEDYSEKFGEAEGFRAIGQKDADLLFWKPAHPRLARYLPEGRFIITLRDPVKRAWSHYWNEVGKGRETLSFEEALKAEDERCLKSLFARNHLSYRARGFYEQSLRSFFEHISPSRVLIITLEESRSQPKQTLSKIYEFIGVDPHAGLEHAGNHHNENYTMLPRQWAEWPVIKPLKNAYIKATEGVIVRVTKDAESRRRLRRSTQSIFRQPVSRITMPERIASELSRVYAPHKGALETLLGRRLPEWDH